MIQYDTCDYTMEACRKMAAELRASGKYSSVIIRRKGSEDGRDYGRVYVERIGE